MRSIHIVLILFASLFGYSADDRGFMQPSCYGVGGSGMGIFLLAANAARISVFFSPFAVKNNSVEAEVNQCAKAPCRRGKITITFQEWQEHKHAIGTYSGQWDDGEKVSGHFDVKYHKPPKHMQCE